MPLLQLVEGVFFLIWWFCPDLRDNRTEVAIRTVALTAAVVMHFWVLYGMLTHPDYDHASRSDPMKQRYRDYRFYGIGILAFIMMVYDLVYPDSDSSFVSKAVFWVIMILPICAVLHALDWCACKLYFYGLRKLKK